MGTTIPKQFLELNSKPILLHTLEVFHLFNSKAQILLVLPEEYRQLWQQYIYKFNVNIPHTIINGGKERFFSVKNAIDSISAVEETIVAIHDGVRPLVTHKTIQNCIEAAINFNAAIPVIPVKESIRIVDNKSSKSIDRSKYRLVQTPQCFKLSVLKEAYQQTFSDLFTDDASVVENLGYNVTLVEGNDENIKITTPSDIKIAEALIV